MKRQLSFTEMNDKTPCRVELLCSVVLISWDKDSPPPPLNVQDGPEHCFHIPIALALLEPC